MTKSTLIDSIDSKELRSESIKAEVKTCFHCHFQLPEKTNIHINSENQIRYFCCEGCKTVNEIISKMGREFFYDLRGSNTLEPVSLNSINEFENLDSEVTYNEFVRETKTIESEVYINITNIHCSACVWLNEKVLSDTIGISQTRINFSTGRAHIVWDDSKLKLSQIFSIIRSIGYSPKLYAPWKKEIVNTKYANDLLIRMIVSAFSFGSIMAFTVSLYAGYFSGIDLSFKRLFHFYSWLLATPVYIYSGVPFFRNAYIGIKNKTLNMDFLLILGISLAYFYSVYVTLTNIGEVYFDSVCMIFLLVLLGKYLEAYSRNIANRKINSLISKIPEICTVIENGLEKKISVNRVQENDLLIVKTGERLSVDGILESKQAHIDESFLTGESKPLHKKKGEKILAGSLFISSGIYIRVLNSSKTSTLSLLNQMIENAMLKKPMIQRKTDLISSKFITIVLFTSIGTFIGWMLYSGNVERAFINAISVLIVACPCALGLAIPSTLVINNIINSEKGIILKNPDIIESLSKLDTLIFDKTGTLTNGAMVVSRNSIVNPELNKKLIFAIEKKSTHPIAKSITSSFLEENDFIEDESEFQVISIEEFSGYGISGLVRYKNKEYQVAIGNEDFLIRQNDFDSMAINRELKELGIRVHVSINQQYIGYLLLDDVLRNEIKNEIEDLKSITKEIVILSGDSKENVKRVANELEINNYHGELNPEEKLSFLNQLQAEKKIVAMVGDGINDAGIIAKANIGISLELASDISIDKSDIILMKNDLKGIRLAIKFALLTSRTIKQNIGISLLYNAVMLPLAAFGFMQPVYCALFMTLSSLTVIGNSFLLKFYASKV